MLASPVLLGVSYLVAAFVFSLAYYAAWRVNSDVFIVHHEMNLRPLVRWKKALSAPNPPVSSPSTPSGIDEISKQYVAFEAEEQKQRRALEKIGPELDRVSQEVSRLGALHNDAMTKNLTAAVERRQREQQAQVDGVLSDLHVELKKNPTDIATAAKKAEDGLRAVAESPAPDASHYIAEATKTPYLLEMRTAIDERDRLSRDQIDAQQHLDEARAQQRSLLESWADMRRGRIGYFDFLYFSMGVATSNTFGDIIPNGRLIRFIIVVQLLASALLVGLFLNALTSGAVRP